MKLAKLISIILVFSFILIACASCDKPNTTEVTTNVETQSTTIPPETTVSTTQTEATTSVEPVVEPVDKLEYIDYKTHQVGEFVTITYSEEFCDVIATTKKGLGASEEVTIEVKMKDGYVYTGLTLGEYIDNYMENRYYDDLGVEIKLTDEEKYDRTFLTNDLKYTFTAEEDMAIYVNYDVRVVYHLNGGSFVNELGTKESKETYESTYPLSQYKCPVTLKAGTFVRDGYVLSEYALDEEGNERVSVGSRFKPNGNICNVYCVWEKASDAGNFTYVEDNGNISISKYNGDETNVVIPEEIDGKAVTVIGTGAFNSSTIERIFVPRTVEEIDTNAIQCANLVEVVLHDGITSMSDSSFKNCKKFTSLRINSVQELFSDWCRGTYAKMDRLLWAKDMKKIVLYGGSGTMYGWDCELLTSEFGEEYVIVNLGMNANMCSCVFIEGLSQYMNDGDIFLWASEPGANLLGDTTFNSRTWWFVFSSYDIFRNVDISEYRNVFSTFANWNKEHMTKPMSMRRSRNSINAYGDDVSVRPNLFTTTTYRFNYFNNDYSHLTDVYVDMLGKGIKVLYTYPAMAKDCGGVDDSSLEQYKNNLLSNFDIEIISDYHDCLYDNSLFWNSEWHMTLEGAHERTIRVIEDLKAYFEANK